MIHNVFWFYVLLQSYLNRTLGEDMGYLRVSTACQVSNLSQVVKRMNFFFAKKPKKFLQVLGKDSSAKIEFLGGLVQCLKVYQSPI